MRRFAFLPTTALGIILLVGGCSNGPKDQDLATTIKGQMFSNAALRAANVNVAVKDGDATLSGDIPDDTARYQAFKIASDTPGVKHVVDKMTVQAAQAAAPAPPVPEATPIAPPKPARITARERKKEERRKVAKSHPATKAIAPVEVAQVAPPPPPPSQPPQVVPPPQVTAPPQPETTPQADVAPPPPPPPPPAELTRVEIPAGTPVRIQMIDSVDSAKNHVGDLFHASLASPLVVNNQIVVPAGVDVYVKLTNVQSAGHISGQSELALELVRLEFQDKEYSLASSQYKQSGTSRGKQSGERIGGGAVIGAVLGAVLGGGKGAAIGAATGAGAGTVVQGATNAQQIRIASETKLDFTLEQPVNISFFPDKNRRSDQ